MSIHQELLPGLPFSASHLGRIPREVLYMMLETLAIHDIFQIAQACRELRDCCEDVFERRFRVDGPNFDEAFTCAVRRGEITVLHKLLKMLCKASEHRTETASLAGNEVSLSDTTTDISTADTVSAKADVSGSYIPKSYRCRHSELLVGAVLDSLRLNLPKTLAVILDNAYISAWDAIPCGAVVRQSTIDYCLLLAAGWPANWRGRAKSMSRLLDHSRIDCDEGFLAAFMGTAMGKTPDNARNIYMVLVEHGYADPPDEDGINVLEGLDQYRIRIRAGHEYAEIMAVLLKHGADVHIRDDFSLRCQAFRGGHPEVARMLLEHGANVHADDDGALRWAALEGHVELARILLERGADPHGDGDYAIHMARSRKHTEVERLLLEHGVGEPAPLDGSRWWHDTVDENHWLFGNVEEHWD